ncbi:hypothetical protein FV219_10505 [Methylobacterium sp. WL122]|nr:hypothetical protein FV219_10505 [Methylobacterium sp. WL122]
MTDVYRNRVRRVWSVCESGLVVAHVDAVCLYDVTFIVSEAARQRALRKGQRAVMAWARGRLIDAPLQASSMRVSFDPFAGPSFMIDDWPIREASLVHFTPTGCWAVL